MQTIYSAFSATWRLDRSVPRALREMLDRPSERHVLLERVEAAADLKHLPTEVFLAIEQSVDGVERVASPVHAMTETGISA